MSLLRRLRLVSFWLGGWFSLSAVDAQIADDFEGFLKPLLAKSCVKCHGGEKVKGKVNLKELATREQFLAKPALIQDMIGAIDALDMPPEEEPGLDEDVRTRLLATLRVHLRVAVAQKENRPLSIRRLNRFQYNYAVRDLFELDRDLFHLPEKLMTRFSPYLGDREKPMAKEVEVACLSLQTGQGMKGVEAFPKDLRAAHGFNNQANQLTLSPLLLDSFLRLGGSIVGSPDFNAETVGIWESFFKEPAKGVDRKAAIRKRLAPFLQKAFRRPVNDEILNRYTAYAVAKLEGGQSFIASMKLVASAIITSPYFLHRYEPKGEKGALFGVASDLSFFLWSSGPDEELLRLAASGALAHPEVYRKNLDRMLSDPKIERFLDSFAGQWLQLENLLAARPDPGRARFFSLDPDYPASLHMVLEPLLLFDAVFLENRPVKELLVPSFSYRSDLLTDWYTTDLKAPSLDKAFLDADNAKRKKFRTDTNDIINKHQNEMSHLLKNYDAVLEERSKDLELGPGFARWEATYGAGEWIVLSSWYRVEPKDWMYDGSSIDLRDPVEGEQWREGQSLVDGEAHDLEKKAGVTVLYRTVQSDFDRSLELSVGSDRPFKLWFNGQLVEGVSKVRGADLPRSILVPAVRGENHLLLELSGAEVAFEARPRSLPDPVVAALKIAAGQRPSEQQDVLMKYYRTVGPELDEIRQAIEDRRAFMRKDIARLDKILRASPRPQDAQERFDEEMRKKLRSRTFRRVPMKDARYGGIVTNAAMLSMTSGPKRTHPIARGAWVIEVVFNDPPPPPPNNVPPLKEEQSEKPMTIRETFAKHRENPDCAGCHSRIDPLGFALENFDITGRWRDRYGNGREVDASGKLLKRHLFRDVVQFKKSLVAEEKRIAKAFTAHLLRFALARELEPSDSLVVDQIVKEGAEKGYRLQDLLRQVALSSHFRGRP